ncbi:hypothetical protein OAT67_03935 [Bacteriovoracaceae bacterium]|nr:hypothetical protein [Bacteriovoracaceae bacterium]
MRLLGLITFFILINSLQAKMFVRKEQTLFTDRTYSYNEKWTKIASTEEESLKEIIKFLSKSKTGKAILLKAKKKAAKYGETLSDIIKVGNGSLTDTTLIRKFSPSRPDQVVMESKSTVYLNKNLTVMNATLDLAHELTHYTFRKAFNPYQVNFSLPDFVKSTVEGTGGEVDAYLVECKVLTELFPVKVHSQTNCSRVVDPETGKLSRHLGRKEFYKMGNYFQEFQKKMSGHSHDHGPSLTHASNESALFISSAYGLPYPMAAVQEYESIMSKVCENDKKRLALMKERISRSPASDGQYEQNSQVMLFAKMNDSFKNRCSSTPFNF